MVEITPSESQDGLPEPGHLLEGNHIRCAG
jgi:hypothetical protein